MDINQEKTINSETYTAVAKQSRLRLFYIWKFNKNVCRKEGQQCEWIRPVWFFSEQSKVTDQFDFDPAI